MVCVYAYIHTYIYIQWNIILPCKENPVIYNNNMDEPEDIMLSEISQAQKDRYCMGLLICGI